MKVRSLYHNPKGERGVGKLIVGWTWLLAAVYSLPKLFRKPPEGSSRWKEYKQVLRYNFSHESLWLCDEQGKFWGMFGTYDINSHAVFKYTGQCFSSTTRGDANGVRFASADKIIGKHPERWSYIEFEVDTERLDVAIQEAKRLVGRKYDYWGLFGFFNPLPVQDKNRWYCSEICNWFKSLLKISKRSKRISPRRSAYILAQKYGEPKPVSELVN